MTLADAIRGIRVMHDLTQAELADTLGHSQSWCARVERGDVQPTAGDLAILSADLGLTLIRGVWVVRPLSRAKSREMPHA